MNKQNTMRNLAISIPLIVIGLTLLLGAPGFIISLPIGVVIGLVGMTKAYPN